MTRSLSDWANVAEVLTAVAIVFSLIFVGLEIRSNTQVTRAAAYERNIDSMNQLRLELVRDADLARSAGAFFERIDEEATVEDVKSYQLFSYVNTLFGVYEKSFYAYQYGVLAEREWARFERAACMQRSRAIERGMWTSAENLYTDDFWNYLEAECED
jgi:CHASE1-domain containing sensor protein